ncbi:hypothetical protein [Streptomyces sp. NPDC058295]|uniref:hypothetical protein n=1 Tax=Streptomyces sp. NPDC058295 TaxID=3346431 RepID=UPI0036E4E72A
MVFEDLASALLSGGDVDRGVYVAPVRAGRVCSSVVRAGQQSVGTVNGAQGQVVRVPYADDTLDMLLAGRRSVIPAAADLAVQELNQL